MNKPLEQALGRLQDWLYAAVAYPVGLQMGVEQLNLVQMQKTAAGLPAFRAVAALDYECAQEDMLANPRRLKALLKRAYAEQPFKGKHVVACMAANQVKIMVVNYSLSEGQSDAEAILRELGDRVKGNPDGTVLDYLLVRPENYRGQEREAIVAMAARDQVTAYLDLLHGAGLQVEALDIGPLALTRLASWIASPDPQSPPNMLLINFGSVSSYITVVWGRRLMLDRGIEFAEQRLVAKVATLLDMPAHEAEQLLVGHGFATGAATPEADELSRTLKDVLLTEFAALAAEVGKTLIYTASKTRGRTVDKIYLLGSIARYPGIGDLLSDLIAMPVEVLEPFSIFPHRLSNEQSASLSPHSRFAVATGLALRNVKPPWLNLT